MRGMCWDVVIAPRSKAPSFFFSFFLFLSFFGLNWVMGMLDRVRTCQGLYVNQCIITIFDWLKFYGTNTGKDVFASINVSHRSRIKGYQVNPLVVAREAKIPKSKPTSWTPRLSSPCTKTLCLVLVRARWQKKPTNSPTFYTKKRAFSPHKITPSCFAEKY